MVGAGLPPHPAVVAAVGVPVGVGRGNKVPGSNIILKLIAFKSLEKKKNPQNYGL